MNRNEEILYKKRISGMHYQDRLCTLLIMFQLLSVTKIRMSIGTSPPIVSPLDLRVGTIRLRRPLADAEFGETGFLKFQKQ